MTPAQIERAAQTRELIHERLGFVRLYATIAQQFAEAGDDAGLQYALEKMTLYARAALEDRLGLAELREAA